MTKGDATELAALAILLREGIVTDPVPTYDARDLRRAVGNVGASLAWNTRPLPKRPGR